MKRYVEKEQRETTSVLSDWVGIYFSDGIKGAIFYIGDSRYHIICNCTYNNHNEVVGGSEHDGSSIKDVIIKCKRMNIDKNFVNSIYCFDSFGELMQWFTDGIKE